MAEVYRAVAGNSLGRGEEHKSEEPNCCHKASSAVVGVIERVFFKFALLVARHPWNTIIVSILIAGGCGVGIIKFYNEKDPMELWVPRDSRFLRDTKWIIDHMQSAYRIQSVIITAPNVLEPDVLMKAYRIHEEISKLSGHSSDKNKTISWNDVCLKVPFIASYVQNRRKRQIDDFDFDDDEFLSMFDEEPTDEPRRAFNPTIDLPSDLYCDFVNKLPLGCLEQNLLELWSFQKDTISQLTSEEIAEKIVSTKSSPFTGHLTEFRELLGGTGNESAKIESANAVMSHWFLSLNFSEVNLKETGNIAGTEEWATLDDLIFEQAFLEKMVKLKDELEGNGTKIYFASARSFGDISSKTMLQEAYKIIIGVVIMFIFIEIVLSKFSWLEIRFGLGGCGLLSVGLAFFSSVGICSAIGIPYGPVHASLPFLLMGLGVDDVFVMMACWRHIKNNQGTIEHRMGLMLKHAGSSITVTSLTDTIAFIIGSLTVIPSLRSFCIYAAVGVAMTYFFALTFFLACFVLDERRIVANRNAFLPCLAHKGNVSKLWCNLNLMDKCLNKIYSKFILTLPGKLTVICTVIVFFCISIESLTRLEQKFDQNWFIPQNTYLHDYLQKEKTYFPASGFEGHVFMAPRNHTRSLPRMYSMVEDLEKRNDIVEKVDSWIKPYFEFVRVYYQKDLKVELISDEEWRFFLSKFLFSQDGGRFQAYFRFNETLKCGFPAPNVTISWINFRFKTFYSRNDYLPAMHAIEDLVSKLNFTQDGGFAAVWSKAFANWITDEIIDKEVFRNIGLALVCVMACTIVMIVDIQTCVWIFICVLLTLVNVGGFMQKWGLTIDLVSCIGLQLAVGLCVDYAAHIGNTFITTPEGDRNERALSAVMQIGGAVIYGGTSTLVALLMLSGSQAYTFKSFFKIFLLVIVFGLFHGVVFLPVVLSVVGPKSIKSQVSEGNNLKKEEINGEELQTINTDTKAEIEVNGVCELD